MASAPFAAGCAASLEGSHGILYVCGEKTCGKLTVNEALLGRKVRGIHGGYDQFVAVVDAWELEWEQHCDSDVALEHEVVTEGLQRVKIHQVVTGKQHRLALSLDGEIFSWGARDSVLQSGELGQVDSAPRLWKNSSKSQRLCISSRPEDDTNDENYNNRDTEVMLQSNTICRPRRVHASNELFFRKIACGRSHGVAITDKGDLYTWGRNFEGQLGHFSSTLSKERNGLLNSICPWPKFVSVFLSKPRVVDVSCGEMFTVALLENGAIYRFGERFTGVTKHPETKGDAHPHLLIQCGSDGAGFVAIACGFAHALAVTTSGQLYSWGWNNYGQLGTSSISSTAIPQRVELPAVEWSKVFAGGNYSAGITTNGELHTWGVGKHGQLAHGLNQRKCEFAPKSVDELQHTVVSAVVCGERNLYAFAPIHIAGISPQCGEITGGYELRIKGSGLWASEDLTVRFIPLTEGRLPRGSLGVYNETTQEVVCQVPKFSLAGEFAVEVATNGKHFTTNGHVFSAFKRPLVSSVSIYETRLAGGEEASIVLDGHLPKTNLQQPIVRFIPCAFDPTASDENQFQQLLDVDVVDVLGTLDIVESSTDTEDYQSQLSPSSTRVVRFIAPPFAFAREVLPCLMEISYNGGQHFVSIAISQPRSEKDGSASGSSSSEASSSSSPVSALKQHIVWYHDASVLRIRPNSFLTSSLPQIIQIEVDQLLLECGGISAIVRVDVPMKADDAVRAAASATLKIQTIADKSTISCVIPPLSQWEHVEEPIDHEAPAPSTGTASVAVAAGVGGGDNWWKRMPRTGFPVALAVSMNGGKSFLPFRNPKSAKKDGNAELFALPAMGNLWNVFPAVGMVCGGTKISISGDFFHFDTLDAVVSLQWRDKYFQVPAICVRLNEEATGGDLTSSSEERRVVFQTPPLPFPNDQETAETIAEGLVLGSHEEVEVFVALDGSHFASKSLKFAYCPVPVVLDISPLEAEPGAKMTLRVERLVPSPSACVRLTSVSMGISTVSDLKWFMGTTVSSRQGVHCGWLTFSFLCVGCTRSSDRGRVQCGVCASEPADIWRRSGAGRFLCQRPAICGENPAGRRAGDNRKWCRPAASCTSPRRTLVSIQSAAIKGD